MTWFETLTGFRETSANAVRANIVVHGETLISRANGQVMTCGRLETPSLAELRERVRTGGAGAGKLSVREVVADVQSLHSDESNAGALFQAASQFNLLEMVSPSVTPEEGIAGYGNDRTQGPACALAAGAGTIYRNYFTSVNGRTGQSADNQIDCLADIGRALGNDGNRLWVMRNGYALASESGLFEISNRLDAASEGELDELRKLLRIGIQWNTQVTLEDLKHTVSQAYCAALPVAYSMHALELWEKFARLILEASYEATICAAILNTRSNGNLPVYLTLLGGGAFGNPPAWILDGIQRALTLYGGFDLDVAIVSHGASNPCLPQRLARSR